MKLEIISLNKEGGIKDVTVLEGSVFNKEEVALWNHKNDPSAGGETFIRRSSRGPNYRLRAWRSCVAMSVTFVLVVTLFFGPWFHFQIQQALQRLNTPLENVCQQTCSATLVESIPEGLSFKNGSIKNPTTFQTWLDLIEQAEHTIEIGSFYWTLRQTDVYPDPSSKQGEQIFDAILRAGVERGIDVKIAQNLPSKKEPNTDTELLIQRKAAQVKSLDFDKLIGLGVLHTKLWIIDRKHFYIGSANMDWRALTQVKELGVLVTNCSCLANDIAKIFEVYWALGDTDKIPDCWPASLGTNVNLEKPMNVALNGDNLQVYVSSAPPQFNPKGRTSDIDAIVNVIGTAKKFVYVSVMDYVPLMIYSPRLEYYPYIDNALRAAALRDKVEVRLLISYWKHSRSSEAYFLKSLADLSGSYPNVTVSVRRFIVPASPAQRKIPFARVNHNKYMVTDNKAYIGTSNWSGDYFVNTAGVGFVVHSDGNSTEPDLRDQLQAVFERDWNSAYAHPVKFNDD